MSELREGKHYELRKSAIRAARQDGFTDEQFEVGDDEKGGFAYKVMPGFEKMREQFAKHVEKERIEEEKREAKLKPVGIRPTPKAPDHDHLREVEANLEEDEEKDKEWVKNTPLPPEPPPPAPPKPFRKPPLTPEQMYKLDMEEVARRRAAERAAEKAAAPPPPPPPPPEAAVVDKVAVTYKCSVCQTPFTDKAELKKHFSQTHSKTAGRLHKSLIEGPTKAVWYIADELFLKNTAVTRKEVIAECVKRGIAFYTARTQYQQYLAARRESDANAKKVNSKK